MQKSTILMISLIVILTNIIVGGVVYCWKSQTNVVVYPGKGESTNMTAPKAKVENKQDKAIVNCEDLGEDWTLFNSDNTTLSFCYQPAWGRPMLKEIEIDPRARVGTMYYVDFVNLRDKDRVLISYSTPDFEKTGSRDTSNVTDWSKLDFNEDSAQMVQLLSDSENAKGVKLMINNKQVFKMYQEVVFLGEEKKTGILEYFMPNVNIDGNLYNLSIKSSASMENEADKLLESLTF